MKQGRLRTSAGVMSLYSLANLYVMAVYYQLVCKVLNLKVVTGDWGEKAGEGIGRA